MMAVIQGSPVLAFILSRGMFFPDGLDTSPQAIQPLIELELRGKKRARCPLRDEADGTYQGQDLG